MRRLKKIISNIKLSDYIDEQINNEQINKVDINKIPDIMYFGSDKKLDELKNRVFLTPLIGIASMFVINIKDIKILQHSSCNIAYEEWNLSDDELKHPLTVVNINHNIKEITNTETGFSNGYIYKIDVSKIKDKLSLFITNDPNRELIYNDSEPLNIIEIIPNKVQWTCKFSQDNANLYGYGVKY